MTGNIRNWEGEVIILFIYYLKYVSLLLIAFPKVKSTFLLKFLKSCFSYKALNQRRSAYDGHIDTVYLPSKVIVKLS